MSDMHLSPRPPGEGSGVRARTTRKKKRQRPGADAVAGRRLRATSARAGSSPRSSRATPGSSSATLRAPARVPSARPHRRADALDLEPRLLVAGDGDLVTPLAADLARLVRRLSQ